MNAAMKPPVSGSIKFLTGPLAGQTFPINKPVTTIGRESTNDIVVKGDQKVSRSHARIIWNNGIWSIEKLSPQNKLAVNQQQIQQATITDGNTISWGTIPRSYFKFMQERTKLFHLYLHTSNKPPHHNMLFSLNSNFHQRLHHSSTNPRLHHNNINPLRRHSNSR